MGTWNIRSLQGKENELTDEFIRADLDILAITETKKKEKGTIELEKGHILIYSGVDKNKRAAAGVGCIVHKKLVNKIKKWEAWSDRILTVEIQEKEGNHKTFIIVYGPNEDGNTENKDKFWEELMLVTENSKGKLFVLGDFNV